MPIEPGRSGRLAPRDQVATRQKKRAATSRRAKKRYQQNLGSKRREERDSYDAEGDTS